MVDRVCCPIACPAVLAVSVESTMLSDARVEVATDRLELAVEPVACAALITVERLTLVDVAPEIELTLVDRVAVAELSTVDRLSRLDVAVD